MLVVVVALSLCEVLLAFFFSLLLLLLLLQLLLFWFGVLLLLFLFLLVLLLMLNNNGGNQTATTRYIYNIVTNNCYQCQSGGCTVCQCVRLRQYVKSDTRRQSPRSPRPFNPFMMSLENDQ